MYLYLCLSYSIALGDISYSPDHFDSLRIYVRYRFRDKLRTHMSLCLCMSIDPTTHLSFLSACCYQLTIYYSSTFSSVISVRRMMPLSSGLVHIRVL